MYPEIFVNGESQAILNNAFAALLTEKLNAERLFQFSAFEETLKTEYIQIGNQVEMKDQTYDINYIETSHDISGQIQYKVQSEHVSYRLIDAVLDSYANTDTPANILDDLLAGTDFSVGTLDFTIPIIFVVNERASKLNLILRLVDLLGGELGFSNKGFTIDILNSIGQDNGFEIKIKKNLKSISRVIDNRGDLKTAYKINYLNLDESENYALKGLEKADLGDTVKVIDSVIGIDVTNIVLRKTTDPIQETVIDVEIASTLERFTNTFNDLSQSSVTKGDRIYGVKIDQQSGLEIERTDQKARSIFNADEWKAQIGDGFGSYVDAIYFDIGNNRYVFKGELVVEDISGVDADDIDESATRIWADDSWRFTGKTTIDGGSIETDTVTAAKINVAELSAINADLGTITAGTINAVRLEIDDDITVGNRIIVGSGGDTGTKSIDLFGGTYVWNGQEWVPSTNPTAYLRSINGDILMYSLGEVNLRSSADSIEIRAFQNLNLRSDAGEVQYEGAEISTQTLTAGNGIDIVGDAIDIDPSEVAGTGITEDGAQNFALDLTYTDDRYCQNESSQEMSFQVFSGELEVFVNGVYQFTCQTKP